MAVSMRGDGTGQSNSVIKPFITPKRQKAYGVSLPAVKYTAPRPAARRAPTSRVAPRPAPRSALRPVVGSLPKAIKPMINTAVGRKITTKAAVKAATKTSGTAYKAASKPVVKKSAIKKSVVKRPVPPSIDEFLRGDTGYMEQEADLARANNQFDAQQANDAAAYGEEYNMNKANLAKAFGEAQYTQTDDYASRSMLNSGLYAKAQNDQQIDNDSRQSAMNNARTQFLNNQGQANTNFDEESRLTGQRARNAAIGRRAAQLGT